MHSRQAADGERRPAATTQAGVDISALGAAALGAADGPGLPPGQLTQAMEAVLAPPARRQPVVARGSPK